MLVFLVMCVVLATSAAYELLEWAAALALGQGGDEFLGTRGHAWDTRSGMIPALPGGCAALLGLARVQDRQIRRIEAHGRGG